MNRKGQALIEFVLILPIFLFLLFAIYDFGMIFSTKNSLESSSGDIINFYKDGVDITELREMYSSNQILVSDEADYTKIVVSDKVKLVTPGFNRIFGNPYVIEVVRYIPNE